MTTITREQAQKIIDAADEVITALAGTNDDVHPDNSTKMTQLYDGLNDHYAPPEVVRELARIALASLTAEPVAWTDEEELRDLRKVGFCEMFSVEPISKDADMLRVIPLYRHAQPTPVVPDYASFEEFWSSFEHPFAEDDELKSFAVEIWNACRAVMLQSKYRDLSQPVDPQISEYEKIMLRAGWVMVPAEPTDEMIAAAMNCEDVLFNSDESFCVQFGNIYEAMLAAAPQPEGNNE
ncbi:TPA: hypothetical protein MPK85_002690 [Salmonella enterica]|nr:hypothetical protein [Salmonella enterica]